MRSKDTLKMLMISMVFGAAMSTCFSPYILVTFLQDYHAGPALISGLQVFLQAALLMGLPGAVLASNFNPKRCTILCLLLSRLPLILLPLMLLFAGGITVLPVTVVFICVFMSLGSSAISGSVNTWFKQIIPPPIQGRFLGNRNAISFGIIAVLTPVIGYSLDHVENLVGDRSIFYAVLFGMTFLLGMIDLYFLNQVDDGLPPVKQYSRNDVVQKFREIWREELWRISLFLVVPMLGITLVLPYLVLMFYDFGLSRFEVGLITAVSTLGQGVGAISGGKYSDRNRSHSAECFGRISFTVAGLQSLALILFISRGYGIISSNLLFAGLLPVMTILSFFQGVVLSIYTRLMLDAVPDGSAIAFGFIGFVGNILVFAVSFISSGIGVLLIGWTPWLRKYFWPEFHYGYVLLALAILSGILGGWRIRHVLQPSSELRHISANLNISST